MEVLITGATGFVGRAVARRLGRAGHVLRALVRNPASAPAQELAQSSAVRLFAGDVLDPDAVNRAAAGTQAVVHLVGIIRECGRQTFENLHVRATEHVLAAARTGGAQRFVHISALGTRPQARSRYHQTKWEAEERVRRSGLTWSILRPSLIYGPGDQFMNRFDRMARFSPVLPLIGRRDARFQPVAVDIVAQCVEAALTSPQAEGRTLDVCGPERLTLAEMLEVLLEVTGRRRWLCPVPGGVARTLATVLERVYPALLRRPPPLNRDQLLMLEEDNVGDPAPMTRLIGTSGPTLREGLKTWLGRR
ncbi:complex I NDUFA9 subunit family protein [Limisphaera sp. VF-2]|jgi:uncharacterized protein YbjT (DUF2867 family)|uniref:complex I NDUFA9 subunit family protein n=1 Tax=Limisphaera sp. VF-2 TaxID=3400418 RepID=UPI00176771EC|nr:complex I NDUFA9 subunit family protein [Limisphaera sp.]